MAVAAVAAVAAAAVSAQLRLRSCAQAGRAAQASARRQDVQEAVSNTVDGRFRQAKEERDANKDVSEAPAEILGVVKEPEAVEFIASQVDDDNGGSGSNVCLGAELRLEVARRAAIHKSSAIR